MRTPLLLSIVAIAANAQTPAFEVASIRPNRSFGGMSSIHTSKGRVSMENVSLKKVMLNAYGIPDDREYTIDGASWLTTERFDIDATFPGDTPLPQVRQMMQTLLAERFKLVLHRETRQLPMYSLVIAKNGLKIHPVEDGQGETSSGPGRLEATKIRVQRLADLLAHFTNRGEVELSVGIEGIEEGRARLHFSVRDTGIGIPPGKQKSIFESFSQADSATTRRYGGTGLGLTISALLLKIMGGRIWVESEPGAGSCFHFTVDVPLAPTDPSSEPIRTRELDGVPVLIVDGNAASRRILAEMAAAQGMTPTVAPGAEEALRELQSAAAAGAAFRLVILDCHMPEGDGFALVEQVRQIETLAGTPILMLTLRGRQDDAARCRTLGVAERLAKPVFQPQLVDAMRSALGHKSERTASAHPATRHSLPGNSPKLRILLAEDNLVNQKVALHLLHRMGHSVTVAATGCEVLAALQKQSFDLILMDIQMPEMDGMEATAAIRENERVGEHIPIIGLTACAMSGDRDLCLASGMDGYVSKPVNVKDLVSEIGRVQIAAPAPLRWGADDFVTPVRARRNGT